MKKVLLCGLIISLFFCGVVFAGEEITLEDIQKLNKQEVRDLVLLLVFLYGDVGEKMEEEIKSAILWKLIPKSLKVME